MQTKKFKFSETSAEFLFDTKDYNCYLQCGPIIGLEYNGPDSNNTCRKLMQNMKIEPCNYSSTLIIIELKLIIKISFWFLDYITENSPSIQGKLDNFYNFADMQMSVWD